MSTAMNTSITMARASVIALNTDWTAPTLASRDITLTAGSNVNNGKIIGVFAGLILLILLLFGLHFYWQERCRKRLASRNNTPRGSVGGGALSVSNTSLDRRAEGTQNAITVPAKAVVSDTTIYTNEVLDGFDHEPDNQRQQNQRSQDNVYGTIPKPELTLPRMSRFSLGLINHPPPVPSPNSQESWFPGDDAALQRRSAGATVLPPLQFGGSPGQMR